MTQERPGETAGFRDEVRAFLRDNLPADWSGVGALPGPQRREFVTSWRRLIGQAKLIGVTWPVEYGGRGLTKIDHLVVVEEFSRAGVPVGTPGDTVSVKLICEATQVRIPEAFSPNGDGRNDRFDILGIGEVDHLVIFNRWGDKVFERSHFYTADIGSQWDGSVHGQPGPVGTYVYFVEMTCPTGGTFVRKGTVILAR